jgi:hypothetical protein
VIDLDGISAARGNEMLLPVWLRLMGTLNIPMFNFKIVPLIPADRPPGRARYRRRRPGPLPVSGEPL